MKSIMKKVPIWAWITVALTVVLAGGVTVNALKSEGGGTGTGSSTTTTTTPSTTTTTIPVPVVEPSELCQTIAEEGYSYLGVQILADLDGSGTQVRAETPDEAAKAYLAALSADVMLVGDAELVYQAAGIHPSRILGTTSGEQFDAARQLELLNADDELRLEVCQQIVLEAERSLENTELSRVLPAEQVTFNMLVHDQRDEMLPRWLCSVPMPENGINVLGYAQFSDPETGNAPEQVLWSLTQRAYVDFGPCPAGGIDFDDVGDYVVEIADCPIDFTADGRGCVELPAEMPDCSEIFSKDLGSEDCFEVPATTTTTTVDTSTDPEPCNTGYEKKAGKCVKVPVSPETCPQGHTGTPPNCVTTPSEPEPCNTGYEKKAGKCVKVPVSPEPCVGNNCAGDKCPTVDGNQSTTYSCDTCEERGDCGPGPCIGNNCVGDACPSTPGNQGSTSECGTCEERGDCPSPTTTTTTTTTTVPTTTTTVPPTTTTTTTVPSATTTTTVFSCPPGYVEDPDNLGTCKVESGGAPPPP